MQRTLYLTGFAFMVVIAASVFGQPVRADEPKGEKVETLQKAIADSKLPDDIKRMAANAKNPIYGKVYYVWPMSNGTFLFGISTPKGGYAFTVKTGDLTADAMVKVILMAYEKQTLLFVFEDSAQTQVAAGVVSVTP